MELHKIGVSRSAVSVHSKASDEVNTELDELLPIDNDPITTNLVEFDQKQTETIILSEGKTLRLLALELFGDKAFWVYIYQENVDIIPNPNRITSGLKLRIPDIDKYYIKKDDSESIYKAIQEGVRVLENGGDF